MQLLLTIFNIIFIVTTVLVAWLYKKHYPKEINDIIGYRTKRSMASKEQWLFANEYCSRLIFNLAMATCVLQLTLYVLVSEKVALLTSIAFWISCLLVAIILTERELKKKF